MSILSSQPVGNGTALMMADAPWTLAYGPILKYPKKDIGLGIGGGGDPR